MQDQPPISRSKTLPQLRLNLQDIALETLPDIQKIQEMPQEKPRVEIPAKYRRKTAPHIVHSGDHAADFDYRITSPTSPSSIMGAYMTAVRSASQMDLGELPLESPTSRTANYDPNHGSSILSPVKSAASIVGTMVGTLGRISRRESNASLPPTPGVTFVPVKSPALLSPNQMDVMDYFSMMPSRSETLPRMSPRPMESDPLPRSSSLHSIPTTPGSMPRSRSNLPDLPLPLPYYRAQVRHLASKLAKSARQAGLEDWDVLDNQYLDELELVCGKSSLNGSLGRSSHHASHHGHYGHHKHQDVQPLIDQPDILDRSHFIKLREFNVEREKRWRDLTGMASMTHARRTPLDVEYLTFVHVNRIGCIHDLLSRLDEGEVASDGWGGIAGENARSEKKKRCKEILALYGF